MIFIKGKIRKRASNQSEASFIENSLSKSALDRSSRSILDEYQKKFDDNQKVLQSYIDLLKDLNKNLSKIGDNVEKQYDWLKNQDFVPSTPGGQEQLDDIGEKLCQTIGDDGSGNPGCNVTLEQLCDITCDKTDETTPQGTCNITSEVTEGETPETPETTTQDTCTPIDDESWWSTCEANADCSYYKDGACDAPSEQADKCTPTDEKYWCVFHGDNICRTLGDSGYSADGNECGLLESNCETLGDTLDCVSLGDYSGNTCYDVGEMNCSKVGEKYCTQTGEQYCNQHGEKDCHFEGEDGCLFEGEDEPTCFKVVDKYMCDNSTDGPDACYETGESNCRIPGEKYCREPGEKFYCFFYEDDACTAIADQTLYCRYYDDDSTPWCEQAVVDACGIPFKDCQNSSVCPPEFGQTAGCGEYEGCGYCQSNCLDCGEDAGPCQKCGQDGAPCQSCGLSGVPCQNCEGGCTTCDAGCISSCNTGCTSSCNTGCTSSCNTGCTGTCQNCEGGCTTCDASCERACQNCEDASCRGGCTKTGQCCEGCTGSCEGQCVSSCVAGTHCDPYVWVCTSPGER